ncbi:MAG: holo-[acyl-carrier protein] synthase [Clostridiales bacterium]|nr:holo-[acyl-carrier protein] synthase [Clostridiales bacterium]
MIKGIGIDMVSVSRMEDVISRSGQPFLDRVFTHKEQEYCNMAKSPFERYAARFAAKEAFFKALGTGLRYGMSWTDIEVTVNDTGRPSLLAYNAALLRMQECGAERALVSISHDGDYAIAQVVLE